VCLCHIDVKTSGDLSSASRVKPLAILATVDLRPQTVGVQMPSTAAAAADSDTRPNDDISQPSLVTFIFVYYEQL